LFRSKKALSKIGKLEGLVASAPARANAAFANDSLNALTSGRPETVKAAPAKPLISAPAPKSAAAQAGRGQGQLRLSSGIQPCVIKALSLKEALLVVRRSAALPQVLEGAVLDLEQGENAEVARLNGYLHAIAALEPKPESDWLQLTFKFVDQDA